MRGVNYENTDWKDKLLQKLRDLPAAREALAMYYCMKDPQSPRRVKYIVYAALAYLLFAYSPIPLGILDEAAVIMIAYAKVKKDITPEHYRKAGAALGKTPADVQFSEYTR